MKDVTHRAVQCNSSSAAVVAVASTGTAMVYAGFKTLALPSSAFAPTLAKLQQQSNRLQDCCCLVLRSVLVLPARLARAFR